MKRYEDFTGGLQKEVRIPEQVWSQYMDTLENIETLAAERKGEDRMGRKRKHAGRTWTKAAAARRRSTYRRSKQGSRFSFPP